MKNPLPWIKAHKVLSFIGLLVITGVLYGVLKPETPPTYITETLTKQTLFQTVDASAEVRSGSEANLAFQTSGRVEALLVHEGDTVFLGQPLAVLDTSSFFAGTMTAPLANAYNALLETSSGITPLGSATAIASAEANVVSATTSLNIAQTDLEETKQVREATVAEMETAFKKAERDLLLLQRTLAESAEEIRADFASVLQGNVIAIRSTLADADTVLGITNTLANDDLEDVLSLTNEQLLTSAKNAYETALRSLNRVEARTFTLSETSPYSEMEPVITDVTTTLLQTAQTLLYTHQALDATIIDTQAFTFEDLVAKKMLIDTARDTIRLEQDALETQTQLRTSTRLSHAQQIASAEFAEESARLALQKTRVLQDQAVEKAISAVKNATAVLEQQLANAMQTIGSTEGQLRDAQIVSPIEGVVTEITIDAGEFATAGTTIVKVQSIDPARFELVADIAEADISKITIGQPVDVELDAYGSSETFPAQIASIDLSEKTIEGVVFYEATLFFTTPEALPLIKPGMTANVVILVNTLSDILSIPQRAIQTNNGNTFVRRKKEEVVEEVTVILGRRTDGGRVEILEGLSENDVVILSIQ